uniref:DNA helicase Pif1-like 2B domain-containing protein n=1 Tax=Tanacetum cinerariifolium TaxID=118510 RepID=A0A6L2M4J0_TANCI|nr:hypothetical protein DCAR_032037 [Tanacetum cinerariifolium]
MNEQLLKRQRRSKFIASKFLGVSDHKFALKVGLPMMLLRNIDQPNRLSLDTRGKKRRSNRGNDYDNLRKSLCVGNASQLAERMIRHNDQRTAGFKSQLLQVHSFFVLRTYVTQKQHRGPVSRLGNVSETGNGRRRAGNVSEIQETFHMAGKGYNSAVECHLDVVEVISSSLIIPKPNPPTDALRPIIPDNACILCITAATGTELADAYSPDTVIASSPGKDVYDPWAFYLHAALLRQAFAHCGKFPTAASRRSLGRVSVPVWLIILSDQLLIIALPFPAVVPLPRAGSYTLLTRPPLETPLPVRLACVKHAASVHPEPGSNSP